MQLEDFASIYAILALQLQATNSDEAAMRAYFNAMNDLPVEAVQQSAAQLAREANRRFFPTTAEWVTVAREIEVKSYRRQLSARPDQPWHMDCLRCDDSGWIFFECPDAACGRDREHAPHVFVRPCPCRPTNRTYQRHHTIGSGTHE
jgi:hypothetical protein